MLEPKLTTVYINKSATQVTLKDSTGLYDATTTPGGYGIPNPTSPPVAVGFRFVNYTESVPYLNFVTRESTLIQELLSGYGHTFNTQSLGISPFKSGIHQVKYNVFENTDYEITLTKDSKTITITSGGSPTSWSAGYKAVVLLDDTGNIISKVLAIESVSYDSFTIDTEWVEDTVSGYSFLIGTEGYLKILFTQLSERCVSKKIGEMATGNISCDPSVMSTLVSWSLYILSAKTEFNCGSFQKAQDLIMAVEQECNDCKFEKCEPCANN